MAKLAFQNMSWAFGPDLCPIPARVRGAYADLVAGAYRRGKPTACLSPCFRIPNLTAGANIVRDTSRRFGLATL
jgi:hypothetical protein